MKRILVTLVSVFFACSVFAQTDSIDSYLQHKMKALRIPGMQLAVVRHGKIVLLRSYGISNAEEQIPVNNHTLFPIHSITKAFTGVAVMQLVQVGKLELDAPVSRYLDSLPVSWQKITIRQLMTHMSGIPDIITRTAQMIDSDDSIAMAKVMAAPVLFPPGEKFKYTMTNYILIGRVIDKLTGEPFTKFMKEKQFDVAGMSNTGFSDSRDVIPHLSESYWYMRNVHNKRVPAGKLQIYFRDWPPLIRAAAGINTSAEELAKWSIALQQGKLLDDQSLKILRTPGTLKDGSHQSFSTIVNGYGLGWPVTLRKEHPAYGPTGGSCTAIFIYPQDDLSIVLLTNLTFSNPEAYIDEIAGFYVPEMHSWNGFGFECEELNKELRKNGFADAGKLKPAVSQDQLNGWAYALLAHHETSNALEIFKLNTRLYPQSWNVYDSYGEALESAGRQKDAIKAFKQSLMLNPKNENASAHIKKLQ